MRSNATSWGRNGGPEPGESASAGGALAQCQGSGKLAGAWAVAGGNCGGWNGRNGGAFAPRCPVARFVGRHDGLPTTPPKRPSRAILGRFRSRLYPHADRLYQGAKEKPHWPEPMGLKLAFGRSSPAPPIALTLDRGIVRGFGQHVIQHGSGILQCCYVSITPAAHKHMSGVPGCPSGLRQIVAKLFPYLCSTLANKRLLPGKYRRL